MLFASLILPTKWYFLADVWTLWVLSSLFVCLFVCLFTEALLWHWRFMGLWDIRMVQRSESCWRKTVIAFTRPLTRELTRRSLTCDLTQRSLTRDPTWRYLWTDPVSLIELVSLSYSSKLYVHLIYSSTNSRRRPPKIVDPEALMVSPPLNVGVRPCPLVRRGSGQGF